MKKRHFEIAGWLLFIVSALGFTVASIGYLTAFRLPAIDRAQDSELR